MPDYQSAFNSALSGLDNSVNIPSYTPMPLSGFRAPTPIPISGGNWNMTPSDFNVSPQSNPQNSTSGGSSSLIDSLLSGAKTVGEGFLGDLMNVGRTLGVAVADPIIAAKNWVNGQASDPMQTFKDIYNLWSTPVNTINQNRWSQALGESPDLSQKWYAPSNLIDTGLGAINPFGVAGKLASSLSGLRAADSFIPKLAYDLPQAKNAYGPSIDNIARDSQGNQLALPGQVSDMSGINNLADSILGKADLSTVKPQAAQELEDHINQINEIMKVEKNPQTLESLGNTLNDLTQEHDKIMGQAMQEIGGATNEAAVSAPWQVKTMNANTAKDVPQFDSIPKTPIEIPQPFKSGLWEKNVSGPIMNAVSSVSSKLNDVPYVNKLWNNSIADQLGKNFVKYYGASPETKAILTDMTAAKSSDLQNVISHMRDLAQTHGLNDNELEQMIHHIEGITPSENPKILNAANSWNDILQNGLKTPEGRVLGTNAELGTTFKDKPLLENPRENYYPHKYNESLVDKIFKSPSDNRKVFSTKGPSNKERVFNTVQDAQKAGFKPEMNPYVALGQRLAESSQKLRNADALNKLMDSGVVTKEDKAGYVPTSIPQLSGLNIRPEDEEALRSFFGNHQPGAIMKTIDKANNLIKKGTLYNPLVHGHNILYNGLYLGGAKPAYTMETLKNLAKGQSDEWYQRALRAGAISADRGAFLDNLKSAVKGASNPIKDKIAYALHGVLWDVDKSLRTAIFRQAVENGATDVQAAARANKFMVNYNNLTPFEERVMTRLFPFYRWMKGNLPLQVEQWISNTPKQALYQFAKVQAAQTLTGQPLDDKGRFDAGTLSNEDHIKIDPYVPADEPFKMLHDGVIPFAYSKLHPLLKEGLDQFTNRAYYPSETVAPDGKESMANSTIRNDQAPPEYNAQTTVAHALNTLIPMLSVKGIPVGMVANTAGNMDSNSGSRGIIDQMMGLQQKNTPPTTPGEYLTKALGGFTGRDNPQKDAYYDQKNQQDAVKKHIQYERQNGIRVPKSEYKQAYKKIPFPIGQ